VNAGGPYVGLDYFVEEDAGLFFGRDAERKRIIGNLRASRLTLLYAESGVGKSSLLHAGVSARLRQLAAGNVAERGSARYVPVVFSAWQGDSRDDLIAAVEAAVRPLRHRDAQLELRRDTLEGAIEDAVAAADATLLMILDQFEERFLYEDVDDGFDDELAHCINRRDLRANFLLSVREDAYPLIGPRFKARIANVYGNYLHLDFLEARAARDAVVKPVEAFNELRAASAPPFEVEGALVDAVLNQVRRGRVTMGDGETPDVGADGPARVETAYLQLVMKRLWDEETAAGSRRLRLETLRRLGGADTIVHGHLDGVMAELPDDQRNAAATAFRFLVTSSGRKIALSSEELREFSDADSAALDPALEHLARKRILRPVPAPDPGGVARHELYHDVLAPAILDWRRRHHEERAQRRLEQARERARRLEVRNRRLGAAVIALAAVAVALALDVWDPVPMQKLDVKTVDARFAVRGTQGPDPRLVLIAVDDKTLQRLDPERAGNLPRPVYARMLERLHEDRPAAIALDVMFHGPKDPRGDRALLDAIRDANNRLVLAFQRFQVTTNRKGARIVRADLLGRPRAVRATKVRTGFAGLPNDRDDHIRRTNYKVTTTAGVNADTFAFAAADVARDDALKANALPTAPGRAVGEQSESTTWIDFRGPPGTFRPVSALDVLDGKVPSGAFAGKVVVIGKIARGGEAFRTPLDRGRSMPGPEIQANAIHTILRGAPLRDASWLIAVVAILVLACVPALTMLSRSRIAGVAIIIGLVAVFLSVAQLAFNGGWIISVVVPLVALVTSSLTVAVVVVTRTLRRRRTAPVAQ
jgi:CHASE2 domain-containing sensor protein